MDNWIITNITNALNKWNETLGQIINIITQSPQDFGGGSIWGVITNIHGALQAIGYSLLVLFFCMGIFKTAANVAELKRPEAAVKIFVRFACAKAAITYGMDILLALYSISQGILTTVARQLGSINAAANLPDDIAQAIPTPALRRCIHSLRPSPATSCNTNSHKISPYARISKYYFPAPPPIIWGRFKLKIV